MKKLTITLFFLSLISIDKSFSSNKVKFAYTDIPPYTSEYLKDKGLMLKILKTVLNEINREYTLEKKYLHL